MNAPKENPQTAAATGDQFPDISKLRLSQEFVETAGAKKILTTVPVRKPRSQDFIRVHPDATFREAFAAIELKDDRERYLIMPGIAALRSGSRGTRHAPLDPRHLEPEPRRL